MRCTVTAAAEAGHGLMYCIGFCMKNLVSKLWLEILARFSRRNADTSSLKDNDLYTVGHEKILTKILSGFVIHTRS